MRRQIYIILLSLLFILSFDKIYGACGDSSWIGTYSSNDKKCNRCKEGGMISDINCNSIDTPRDIDPMGITYTNIPPKNYFSPPQYIYKFRYGICGGENGNPWNNTGCNWMIFKDEVMDNNRIVSSLQQCKDQPKNFQEFSDPFFNIASGKICLVRENIEGQNFISAYFSGGDREFWIGRRPYPRLPAPPPFTPGLFPIPTYALQEITDIKGFSSNNIFQKPLAIINFIKGSDIVKRQELQLDLENRILSLDIGSFKVEINNDTPDQLIVSQGDNIMGQVPRPALEQNKSDISFFPCYHTYFDQKQQAYQGVYVFSINKNMGDAIGDNLFLGPNYIPSNENDKIGDIRVTRCDLCINAFEQNSGWDTNIYNNIYTLSSGIEINRCKLNSDISIKKIDLVDSANNKIFYRAKNVCDGYTTIEAPIRVDALDYKSFSELISCTPCTGDDCLNSNVKMFKYESDLAYLDKYLVSVQPVIPLLTNGFEAEFVQAIQLRNNNCSTYTSDVQGNLYIKPAGKRDRSFCFGNDPNGVYTLCTNPNNDLDSTVCTGAYSGSNNPNTDLPDKICIMSGGKWDFISGRYKFGYKNNLNGDDKIVPKMSCTFLPGCKSLGNDIVINIGNAVWNENAAFGEAKRGKCTIASDDISDNDYTYRIDINSYTIDASANNDPDYVNAISELADLKNETSNKMYISIADVNTKSYLKRFLGNNLKSLQCTIIEPTGLCIGGIYGNITPNTECVSVKENGKPIVCKAKTN